MAGAAEEYWEEGAVGEGDEEEAPGEGEEEGEEGVGEGEEEGEEAAGEGEEEGAEPAGEGEEGEEAEPAGEGEEGEEAAAEGEDEGEEAAAEGEGEEEGEGAGDGEETDPFAWDKICCQWLPNTGFCVAGGLASVADGCVFAAADSTGIGWDKLYKDDHEEDVLGEDGNPVGKVVINEPATIKAAIEEEQAPHGVWLGGTKFRIVRSEKGVDYNGQSYDTILCARSKGGAHLVKTERGTIVVGVFDEEKEQSAGNSRNCVLAFADHVHHLGL